MTLIVVGISHKTAPVEFREKFIFPEDLQARALEILLSDEGVDEAVLLSTCNRTEIYAGVKAAPAGIESIIAFIGEFHGLTPIEMELLREHLYIKQSMSAIEHLFRVTASLESKVLGEAQIHGQIKQAYATAVEAGACGPHFNNLFKRAIELGKQVRTETNIGANSVSVSTAAVDLVRTVFDNVNERSVMVVGTGQMGQLAAQYLKERGARQIYFANRTYDHARELAEQVGGTAIEYLELADYLEKTDVLISSTASPDYVIDKKLIARAHRKRRGHSLLLIDIALPRDIDPACAELDDVYLYDLDDLGLIIDGNVKEREIEAVKAEALVAQGVDEFLVWLQEREVTPIIKQMFEKAERVSAKEVERAEKALVAQRGTPITDEERAIMEAMAASIVKKTLHGPTARLRKQTQNPDSYRYTEAARFLFGLESNPEGKTCRELEGRTCRVTAGQHCEAEEQGRCTHADKQ